MIQHVANYHFIEHGENLLILGQPGLTRALTKNRLENELKVYAISRLLIVNKRGYLLVDRAGANFFFRGHLVSEGVLMKT